MKRRKLNRERRISANKYPFTPSTYPGRRPRFSFLFTRKGIFRLKLRTLDQTLARRGLPAVGERYAVLAYGSNACPGQLLLKNLTNLPVLYGRLSGAEAVYANRKTKIKQCIPATLARKKGSRSSWVTLLTAEQLRVMDSSEGRPGSYELAEIPKVQFCLGRARVTPLYSYVNILHGVMTLNGKCVSLRSVRQRRAKTILQASSEEDAAKWLDFEIICAPNPPARYSQIAKP